MPVTALIVDDEEGIRKGVRQILESKQIRVIGEARNGQDAVFLARQLQPNLVLMDIAMPVMDGLEATRVIKQENPAVKIIVLTVHNEEAYLKAAHETGADAFLLKKTALGRLISTIEHLLGV